VVHLSLVPPRSTTAKAFYDLSQNFDNDCIYVLERKYINKPVSYLKSNSKYLKTFVIGISLVSSKRNPNVPDIPNSCQISYRSSLAKQTAVGNQSFRNLDQ
jgi:hypothetical protein